MNATTLLRRVKAQLSADAEAGLARPKSMPVQQMPTSETWIRQHRTWHPDGYYRVFCAHDRLYAETCSMCRRGSKEAARNMRQVLGLH